MYASYGYQAQPAALSRSLRPEPSACKPGLDP